jgi:Tfp pilus assembly protein PilF
MAQLCLKSGNSKQAHQAVEQALSHDFEIKDTALYYLVKARIHVQLVEYEEAIKVLETAISLASGKSSGSSFLLSLSQNSAF